MNNTTRRRPASVKRMLVMSTLHGLLNANRAFSALAIAALLSLPAQLPAQTAPRAATGEVTGRVLNPATGRYLNNARVTADGTDATAFTDDYGEYRLQGVPAGEAKLHIFYSGLGEQTVTVTVPAGQTVTQDISFGKATTPDQAVVLDTFTVAGLRDTDVASIAVNEQRFAPNIKTVIETDAFGDIAEGNIGEFLKYLPGVNVDYVAADVRTVSVRGFGPAFSTVSVDGFRMASAASGGSSRMFEFEQVSINNASRVEVSKVPTPSMPADSLGGSVNLISKNSFEREGAQFNYRAYVNANSEDVTVSKTPGPGNKDSYKILPGFDFDYTLPVTKNLGFVITGLSSNQFNEQHRTQKTWNFAQAGATVDNPFLQNYVMQDGPKNSFRDSISAKMDWRISPNSSMWIGWQSNYYKSFFGNRNITWDTSNKSTSKTEGGEDRSWGSDYTYGATGQGSVRGGGSFRDKLGATNALLAKYRYIGNLWEIDAGAGISISRSWYRDTGRGHFDEVRTTLQGLSRVMFDDIAGDRPNSIRALDVAGNEIDYTNIGNYRIDTVRAVPLDAKDEVRDYHLNVKRDLDFLPFTASLKAGVDYREQRRDIKKYDSTWTFVGADGKKNTADDNAAAYGDERYGVDAGWRLGSYQWYDPYKLWDEFNANPAYFTQTPAQAQSAEGFRIQNSSELTEGVTAVYLQADAHFLNNRLGITTGVRFERTADKGKGPLTPTPGVDLADIQANWRERGFNVDDSYDGYYPSLHVNYNIKNNLILRVAYASTIGRPDFGNILPLVEVNPTDTQDDDAINDLDPHTISYNNTALKPWTADNFDTSLEYYFRNGGVFSAGAFYKEIEGFFEDSSSVATAADLQRLHLDPSYEGFDLLTQTNSSQRTRISGIELNFRQPLDFIPGLGHDFTFFVNATKLHLSGSAIADFSQFIDQSLNTGLIFEHKGLTARVNANFRGRERNSSQTGSGYGSKNGFHEYYAPRVSIDANLEYRFSKHIAAFANVRNVFNTSQDLQRYNLDTPDYSRLYRREKFGAQITVGVKGTF